MSSKQIDFDGNWKRVVGSLFEDFLTFFAPNLAELVDWSRQPDDLNRELQRLQPEGRSRNRQADSLYRVHLKDKSTIPVLVHLEVQGWDDVDFHKRMFQYFYRILDLYGENIYTLVIYINDNEKYMPNRYQYEFYGTKLYFEFNTFVIKEQQEEELIQSPNPFSFVVLAAKKAVQIKTKNEVTKYEIKRQLLGILSEQIRRNALDNKTVAALFRFVDNIIKLDNLQAKFKREVINEWEGGFMLSYDEEIKQEGIKQGKEQGIKVIKLLLEEVPIEEIARKLNLSIKEVIEIRDKFYQ
ncbi:hypothetical protein V6C20_06855 [Caldibacillus thermoamylovorans]